MKELSPLDEQMLMADQHTATAALLLFAVLAFVAARWLFRRRRYPHGFVWALFVLYAFAMAAVPAWRALDAIQPWFYGLRGIPLGLLVVSMTRFAELAPAAGA